jgi:hypothetical protein
MNKKLGILVLLIFATALAWTIHGAIHFSGPYRMVAHWELKLFNEYAPVGTFIIAFGLVGLAFLLPLLPIRLIFFPVKDKAASTAEVLAKVDTLQGRVSANYYMIVGIGVGFVSFAMGVYFLIQGFTAGSLVPVALEDLYREDYTPPSRYAAVSAGDLLWDNRVTVRENRRGTFLYVPLKSLSGTAESETRVVVTVDERNSSTLTADQLTGILTRPLDGFVRDLFQRDGLRISENAWELNVEESPKKLKAIGIFMTLIGSFIGGFFVRRNRRNKISHP